MPYQYIVAQHIDEALTAAPLVDKTMEKNSIFLVPIIVVPGLSLYGFSLCTLSYLCYT